MKIKLKLASILFLILTGISTLAKNETNGILLRDQVTSQQSTGALIFQMISIALSSRPSKLMKDLDEGVGNAITCRACETIVELFKRIVDRESELRNGFITTCTLLRFQTAKVCVGLAERYSKVVFFIITNTKFNSKEICALIYSHNCMSHQEFIKSSLYWEIKIPENKSSIETKNLSPRKNDDDDEIRIGHKDEDDIYVVPVINKIVIRKRKQRNNRENKFKRTLHLTDVHYDPDYSVGSATNCAEPLCCQEISRLKYRSTKAGYWGSYGYCDSPLWTIDATFNYINKTFLNETFDYIIFTGDTCPHNLWKTNIDDIQVEIDVYNDLFNKYFPKQKYVFPVIGNHEAFPVNLFPPPEINATFSLQWLYTKLYQRWKQWIPDSQEKNFLAGGYYSVNIDETLKVIVLNTNFGAKLNFWQLYWQKDLGDQLQWLVGELEFAEKNNQNVHIVGHIAPDGKQTSIIWLYNYLRILERYKNIIKGSFFGHTHYDEMRVYHSIKDNQPIAVGYIAGSLTTYEEVNPNFRIYNLNNQGTVEDFETYYFDINDANERGSLLKPIWIDEYSPLRTYKLNSLSPMEWDKFFQKMHLDNLNYTYFDLFYQNYHRHSKSDIWPKKCRKDCKDKILSRITVMDPLK